MLKEFINKCFGHFKELDPGDAKDKFGILWAVFASKTVILKNASITLSWRELSSQLADIYNEWYEPQRKFTTDAFYNVYSHKKTLGENADFDKAFMMAYEHEDCITIVRVQEPCFAGSVKVLPICHTDVVTGQQTFFKQHYDKGRVVGNPEKIDSQEYDSLCYSMR
jgi:hypothetical protein